MTVRGENLLLALVLLTTPFTALGIMVFMHELFTHHIIITIQ